MNKQLLNVRREIMLLRYHSRKTLEKFRQKKSSHKKIVISEKSVHIICVRKAEYIKAAIRCANSIWYHNPEVRIVLHIDSVVFKHREYILSKMHRKDRFQFVFEDGFESWQELKIAVILHTLKDRDYFCDADLYWNAPIPDRESGMYFAAEKSELNKEPYASALAAAGISIETETFMANSSFISLGNNLDREDFINEVESYFDLISAACQDSKIDKRVERKIYRLREQIALAVAINNRRDYFDPLKESDKPMDGGIAESYYLGTTKGWD